MEGLGDRCREVEGCRSSILPAQSQKTNFCKQNAASLADGSFQKRDASSVTGSGIDQLLAGETSLANSSAGKKVRAKLPNEADFYCPIADTMEWIDGEEGPVPSLPREINVEPTSSTAVDKLSGITKSGVAVCVSEPLKVTPLTNGVHSKNSVIKHSRPHLRSLLGCASYQSPRSSLPVNDFQSYDSSQHDVSEIKIGNSCFYVPSALCSNNNTLYTQKSGLICKNGPKTEKCAVQVEKCKLPNGLSLTKRSIKFINSTLSHTRKSWPNSESSRTSKESRGDEKQQIKGSLSSSVIAGQTEVTSLQVNASSESGRNSDGLNCRNCDTDSESQTFSSCLEQRMKHNVICNNGHEVVKKLCENCQKYLEECTCNALSSISPVAEPRIDSSESSETVDFYDDGVFLEERSPLGENIDIQDSYGACGLCADSSEDFARSQCLESRTCDNSNSFCDSEDLNVSYNFLQTSMLPSGVGKYCEKNKVLDKVFLSGACSESCDNNDDIGDFIEADIPQHIRRLSSPGGSCSSTSSNDEDNVLSCQDLNKVGNANVNVECWESSKFEDKSAFLDDDEATEWCRNSQGADLGRDAVFFSCAPNHNPSLIPGMFRRDARNCFTRVVGGACNADRKPNDLLSDVSAHRPCTRPRGRSDSSSIAKQSSSDSEISNLAFSDSSLLISPEVDMVGFDLLVTNSDVDRVVVRDATNPNSNNGAGWEASNGTLQRNSSEEGFHEALEEELGAYYISGATASGNCCCPNDLSGSSPVQTNGAQANVTSPSAAADANSLNFQVWNPCPRHDDNQDDEACVLTFDEMYRAKSKCRHSKKDQSLRARHAACRDNRCERNPMLPAPPRLHIQETHTNNIIGEEKSSPQEEEPCSAIALSQSLPGSSTDPAGLEEDNEELSEVKAYYKLKKICREGEDHVMIWNEYEAYFNQMKPVLSEPCGPMAVLNMLKALGQEASREEVFELICSRPRDETAPIPEYLFSRGVAGATADDLIEGVRRVTQGAVVGRFFQFYPPRDVDVIKWLAYWIKKGAIPIVTLNLQKGVKNGCAVPDAWHHQMVYGVSSKGVYLTNPKEFVPVTLLTEQLCSDSVLLIQRQDIVSRYDERCQLHKFLQQPDSRWQTMNVLGQVVNVLREETKIPGYRAQVTSHVSIPAIYLSGITLYLNQDSSHLTELTSKPDLPMADMEMSNSPSSPSP